MTVTLNALQLAELLEDGGPPPIIVKRNDDMTYECHLEKSEGENC